MELVNIFEKAAEIVVEVDHSLLILIISETAGIL